MNILVVSPHPDDETLGAGGSILRFKEEGHKIYWLNITAIKQEYGYSAEQVEEKQKQIEKVCRYYAFDGMLDLQLATTKLEKYDSGEIIGKISSYIDKVRPEWIILPDVNDAHSDHRHVFEWCYACTKVFRHPYIKKILTMEIVSETDFGKPMNPFIPNMYVDITDYLQKKLEVMRIYKHELGEHPFPRNEKNIEAWATVRGASAGVVYAEAFHIVKEIY